MKLNHQIKYIMCVVVVTAIAFVIGYTFQHTINQQVGLVLSGGMVVLLLELARLFHAGEPFNTVLSIVVFTGYIAVFLTPLYYIFRSFKWSLVFVQIGLIIFHFLIGFTLATYPMVMDSTISWSELLIIFQ